MWEVREGNSLALLKQMTDQVVQTCITSPPYWGLRDYGEDGQLGLEPTPEEYVANMVEVCREVRRVLRDDGTLWLNLGDSYAGSWGNQGRKEERGTQRPINGGMLTPVHDGRYPSKGSNTGAVPAGLKPKDLCGIPWRVAFALQADGWYLRSEIIWAKPNPMPESVRDRPTRSHEQVFLLTKQPKYYYDAEAIKEPAVTREPGEYDGGPQRERDGTNANEGRNYRKQGQGAAEGASATRRMPAPLTRNKRSVWTVTTQPFKGAHFATFPPKLIEPMILAGSRLGDTVLDPFSGAGTTGLVALQHDRSYIGLELNPEYAAMSRQRIRDDAPLLNTPKEVL